MQDQAPDQVLADADQTAANADQRGSGLDQLSADADNALSKLDQRASDDEQLAADRQLDKLPEVTPADQEAYETATHARVIASTARDDNRVKRARTSRDRDASAGQRDRTGAARDRTGAARDEHVRNEGQGQDPPA